MRKLLLQKIGIFASALYNLACNTRCFRANAPISFDIVAYLTDNPEVLRLVEQQVFLFTHVLVN